MKRNAELKDVPMALSLATGGKPTKRITRQEAAPAMPKEEAPDFSLLSLLDKYIFKKFNAESKRSRGVFHPSELEGCARSLALDYIKAPMNSQELPARLHRIFENGHSVHDRLQGWLADLATQYRGDFFFKPEVKIWSQKWEIDGHTDGWLHYMGHDYLIEIKSMNMNEFEKLRKPKPEHTAQFNIYLGVMQLQKGFIIYENKNNQDWKEFIHTFDPEMWKEATDHIDYIRGEVKAKRLPPREETSSCRNCKFRAICVDKRLTDEEIFAVSEKQ